MPLLLCVVTPMCPTNGRPHGRRAAPCLRADGRPSAPRARRRARRRRSRPNRSSTLPLHLLPALECAAEHARALRRDRPRSARARRPPGGARADEAALLEHLEVARERRAVRVPSCVGQAQSTARSPAVARPHQESAPGVTFSPLAANGRVVELSQRPRTSDGDLVAGAHRSNLRAELDGGGGPRWAVSVLIPILARAGVAEARLRAGPAKLAETLERRRRRGDLLRGRRSRLHVDGR